MRPSDAHTHRQAHKQAQIGVQRGTHTHQREDDKSEEIRSISSAKVALASPTRQPIYRTNTISLQAYHIIAVAQPAMVIPLRVQKPGLISPCQSSTRLKIINSSFSNTRWPFRSRKRALCIFAWSSANASVRSRHSAKAA